jgi:hypothetical protein
VIELGWHMRSSPCSRRTAMTLLMIIGAMAVVAVLTMNGSSHIHH